MSIEPSMLGDFEVLERYQGGEGWSGKVRRRKGDASAMILKVLEPGMEVREGSLLASLEHPRIPRLLDTGCTEGNRSFLLREFLPGRPIDSFFPLSPAEANTLAVQLLEILAYVHLRSVLHLDLKPANILRNDAEEPIAYCLLDFGLGSRGRGAGSGGTPFFAPPEVLLGLTPDPRSDLFSLGAVLWLALRTSKSPLPLGRFRQLF
ncbi:MAG: serine/threonine protein kinase, partial [Planctomycetota bacterium]